MNLGIVIPTMHLSHTQECVESWLDNSVTNPPLLMIDNSQNNRGVLASLKEGYATVRHDVEIIAYLHDDVICREKGWDERVLAEFQEFKVGLVGFGGAKQHGSLDLYKTRYDYRQLGRSGYLSNVDDAEVHGQRFNGECQVAVLDGFALIARRGMLSNINWPLGSPINYSLYDYFLCCEAHRHGYDIRLVGIRCHHLGGRTAVTMGLAGTGKEHEQAHRWLYEKYLGVGVLPWKCQDNAVKMAT